MNGKKKTALIMETDETPVGVAPWVEDELAEDRLARAPSPAWSLHRQIAATSDGKPAIGVSNAGESFFVWEENGALYWRRGYLSNVQGWTARAYLAAGQQPSVVGTANGKMHCVFTNVFGGTRNVYYVVYENGSWSLPRNISHTSGGSRHPKIAADGNALFVVWDDDIPGYSVIYGAEQDGWYWISGPIPSGRGELPDVACQGGNVHVVFQDKETPSHKDVIYYTKLSDGSWSLPENLSAYPTAANTDASIVVDATGKAHIAYGQFHQIGGDGYYIYYVAGSVGNWSPPRLLTWYGHHGILPSVRIAGQGLDWVLVTWAHKASAAASPSWIMARKKRAASEYWRWYSTEQATEGGAVETMPDMDVEPAGWTYLVHLRGQAVHAAGRRSNYP